MILLADSGSTKTSWCLINKGREFFSTQGINPFQQTEEQITEMLLRELITQISEQIGSNAVEVHFYGAGCTPEKAIVVEKAIRMAIPNVKAIEVKSDMLGAARALCKNNEGIVAILGTGANSCLYDGKEITENTPALGFILGDEGSGANLGKRLVGDVLKGQLPADICRMFHEETGLNAAEIIQRTYREPLPNRFLASISPFLAHHIERQEIQQLVEECFCSFVSRNLLQYLCHTECRTVHFVGSIAYYYRKQLEKALIKYDLKLGTISQSPITLLSENY